MSATASAAAWVIRVSGVPEPVHAESAHAVLEGLREGEWEPSDEVRGPSDADFLPIEDHPVFADAVAEMGPPPAEKPDETRLDMNPLIDVALVLLIFFILTTTYASLKRSIDLPPAPDQDGKSPAPVKPKDIEDRSFRMQVYMDGPNAIVKLEGRVIPLDDVDREVKEHVRNTGRKELFLSVADDVPWGIEAKVYDAAKGAEIHQIYWPRK